MGKGGHTALGAIKGPFRYQPIPNKNVKEGTAQPELKGDAPARGTSLGVFCLA